MKPSALQNKTQGDSSKNRRKIADRRRNTDRRLQRDPMFTGEPRRMTIDRRLNTRSRRKSEVS